MISYKELQESRMFGLRFRIAACGVKGSVRGGVLDMVPQGLIAKR